MDLDSPRERLRSDRLLRPLTAPLPHPLPTRLNDTRGRPLRLLSRENSAMLLPALENPRSRGRALAAHPDPAGAGAGKHGVEDREPDEEQQGWKRDGTQPVQLF